MQQVQQILLESDFKLDLLLTLYFLSRSVSSSFLTYPNSNILHYPTYTHAHTYTLDNVQIQAWSRVHCQGRCSRYHRRLQWQSARRPTLHRRPAAEYRSKRETHGKCCTCGTMLCCGVYKDVLIVHLSLLSNCYSANLLPFLSSFSFLLPVVSLSYTSLLFSPIRVTSPHYYLLSSLGLWWNSSGSKSHLSKSIPSLSPSIRHDR